MAVLPSVSVTVMPALSLSAIDTLTSATAMPLKPGFALLVAEVMIVLVCGLASSIASSTARAFTITPDSAFAGVSVTVCGETPKPLPVSTCTLPSKLSCAVTLLVGAAFRLTRKLSVVVPASLTDRLVGATVAATTTELVWRS